MRIDCKVGSYGDLKKGEIDIRQDLIEVFKMFKGMTRIRLQELFTLEEINIRYGDGAGNTVENSSIFSLI